MEPVTHLLTGACLARSGLNRRAAYATLTMVVAAEFPDIDVLWGVRGPVAAFEHHRGITHTFLGLPFEAAFVVAAVYGLHRWRVGLHRRRMARAAAAGARMGADPVGADPVRPATATGATRAAQPLTAAPVSWGWLYALALLALLSHLLLDYTNNYGLRPFYPFNPHWYAASIVSIFDPLMFVLLLAGVVAPELFGLVSSEVGVRRRTFRGRAWAIAALLGVVALWTLREFEHTRAVQLALSQSMASPAQYDAWPGQGSVDPAQHSDLPAAGTVQPTEDGEDGVLAPTEPPITYLAARRVLASPDPLSPFRWPAVIDFGPVYRLAEIDTRNGAVRLGDTLQPKPDRSPAVVAAEASPLGRFYMNWSPMPFVSVSLPDDSAADPSDELNGGGRGDTGPTNAGTTLVTFRDPRFMGQDLWMRDSGHSPLSATVTVDAAGRVVHQSMGDGGER